MARLRARDKPIERDTGSTYSLRKRRSDSREVSPLEVLLKRARDCQNVVVFTGSGLSAASGMSTFTSKGGLYERAQKRFRLSEGKKLFCYPFFERQKKDAQAFYAEIYKEARKATPGRGHDAIKMIEDSGQLVRHYTLNVDGLAKLAECSTWHAENSPEGKTVEMHGSITQMVCTNEDCKSVSDIDDSVMIQLLSKQDVPCKGCGDPSIRCRIMLYDDKDGEFITPDDIFELMEEDVSKADMILWVGISFEQSASTHYFRKAREFLLRAKHWKQCTQAVVNLSDEAHFNLLSACNNIDEVDVLNVRGSSDDVLSMIAKEMAVDVITAKRKRSRKSQTPVSTSPDKSAPLVETKISEQSNGSVEKDNDGTTQLNGASEQSRHVNESSVGYADIPSLRNGAHPNFLSSENSFRIPGTVGNMEQPKMGDPSPLQSKCLIKQGSEYLHSKPKSEDSAKEGLQAMHINPLSLNQPEQNGNGTLPGLDDGPV